MGWTGEVSGSEVRWVCGSDVCGLEVRWVCGWWTGFGKLTVSLCLARWSEWLNRDRLAELDRVHWVGSVWVWALTHRGFAAFGVVIIWLSSAWPAWGRSVSVAGSELSFFLSLSLCFARSLFVLFFLSLSVFCVFSLALAVFCMTQKWFEVKMRV